MNSSELIWPRCTLEKSNAGCVCHRPKTLACVSTSWLKQLSLGEMDEAFTDPGESPDQRSSE